MKKTYSNAPYDNAKFVRNEEKLREIKKLQKQGRKEEAERKIEELSAEVYKESMSDVREGSSSINWDHPIAVMAHSLAGKVNRKYGKETGLYATRTAAMPLIQLFFTHLMKGALLTGDGYLMLHVYNRFISYQYGNTKTKEVDAEFGLNRISTTQSVATISSTCRGEGGDEIDITDSKFAKPMVQHDSSCDEDDYLSIHSSSPQSMMLDAFAAASYRAIDAAAKRAGYRMADLEKYLNDNEGEYTAGITQYGDASNIIAKLRKPEGKKYFRSDFMEEMERKDVDSTLADNFLSGMDNWTGSDGTGFRNSLCFLTYRYIKGVEAYGKAFA